MTEGRRFGDVRDLPDRLIIFPLSGAILLPHGRLPLNIFEPRYLNMVDDALGADRMIGMIQPTEDMSRENPALFQIGCAGRMTSFSESEDGRYLITLTGLCRFAVAEEIDATTPYRQILPDWSRFAHDLEADPAPGFDRHRLLESLRAYLAAEELDADWRSIERAPPEALVNSLSMICPFDEHEKQALLEAPRVVDRAQALVALMQMAIANPGGGDDSVQ